MIKKTAGMMMAFFFLLTTTTGFASIPVGVSEFAQKEGLMHFKELLSKDASSISDYGYSSVEELDQAVLGPGFQVYRIDPDKLKAADESTEMESILEKTEQWEYIVLVDGLPKSLLGVGVENGELSLTKAGGYAVDLANAAKEIEALQRQEPPILFYAQETPVLLSQKDNQPFLTTGSEGHNSELFSDFSKSNGSKEQIFIENLKMIQASPNQHEDSGGRVAETNQQSPVQAITISVLIALLAVSVLYRILKSNKK